MSELWGYSVYVVTNKVNGKVYVGVTGKGVDVRWKMHQHAAKHGRDLHFSRAILKHGAESFDIREVCRCRTQDDALAIEMLLVAEHRAAGVFLYNMTAGGAGTLGLDEGARAKISETLKGRPKSEEHRRRISAATVRSQQDPVVQERMKLARQNPEMRASISEKKKAFWSDPENRERASQSMRKAMTEESRAKRSATSKKNHENPEYVAKKAQAIRSGMTKEATAKIAAGQLKSWADPETRAKRVEAMKKWWSIRKEMGK